MSSVLERADKLIAERKFIEAIRVLDSSIGFDATDLELGSRRVTAMEGLERWAEIVAIGVPSIETAPETASRFALARIHSVVGNAMSQLGMYASSEVHLRAAAHIFTWDLKSPVLALAPIRILSATFSKLGMWSTARHELLRAIEVADRLNATRESIGLRINLAVVLLKSAPLETSLGPLHKALEIIATGNWPKQRVLCKLLSARRARLLGDPSASKRMLDEVLAETLAMQTPREEVICLEYLGDCYSAQREHKSALEMYLAALKTAEDIAPGGDLIAELCHRLAEAHIHLGDANQAILLCDRGLRLARELNDRYEECATHRVLAMAHRAAGNPSKAHRIIQEGIELGRSYEIPYELARALAWAGETRMQSKGRDDQMLGRLQLWEARAVFERIGLSNEVRHLDKILGFEEVSQEAPQEIATQVLADVPNLDRGAFRFGIITTSPEVAEAVATIQSVAPSKIPVLITGPSGVGKELLAHALHRMSDRRKMPFLPVNCGSISASLIESELFGHERGAFTGAIATRDGLFTAADKGTIFLDEIGELPLSTQATLLRVLEKGELRRVGSDDVRTIDVRVVAATNADVEDLVARGIFRKDLFFRLEGVNVKVPPLAEREEDIRVLFRFFLAEAAAAAKKKLTVTDEVEPLLCAYTWPGNVRELKNEVARAVAMAPDGAVLGRSAFLPKLRKKSPAALRQARQRDDANSEERGRILEALRAHGGNKADAARSLGGMKRTTLLYKMERLQIRPEEYLVKE